MLSPFEDPIEEERRADIDQIEDDKNYGKDKVCIPIEKKDYRKKAIDPKKDNNMFIYFLDGSMRTKFIGEYSSGVVSFPLLASEISVAIVKRENKDIKPCISENKLFFIFPDKESGLISDDTIDRLKELKSSSPGFGIEFLKKTNLNVADVRYSMLSKARRLMHEMEHTLAKQLEKEEKSWLIMDGAIRKSEFLNFNFTIGLAKSFSRTPLFKLNNERNPLTTTAYLKNLGVGERSLVFKKKKQDNTISKKTAFWFVRIRKAPPNMEPLGGIVKIDFNSDKDDLSENDLDLIDQISAEIYSMRLPSVYPWPRWPNYIYPIRMAEQYMSSQFLNKEYISHIGMVIKNAISG